MKKLLNFIFWLKPSKCISHNPRLKPRVIKMNRGKALAKIENNFFPGFVRHEPRHKKSDSKSAA